MSQINTNGRGDAFNSYYAKAMAMIVARSDYGNLEFYRQMMANQPRRGSSLWSWIRWAFGAEPKLEGYSTTSSQASVEKSLRKTRLKMTLYTVFEVLGTMSIAVELSVRYSPLWLFGLLMPLLRVVGWVSVTKSEYSGVRQKASDYEAMYGSPEALVMMYMEENELGRRCSDHLWAVHPSHDLLPSWRARAEITGEAAEEYRRLLEEQNGMILSTLGMINVTSHELRCDKNRPSWPPDENRAAAMAIVTDEDYLKAILKYEELCRKQSVIVTKANQCVRSATPCASLQELVKSGEFLALRWELSHFSLPPLPIK